MSKIIQYMSANSRNVIFSKSKNPTSKITQNLGGVIGCIWGELINELLNVFTTTVSPSYANPIIREAKGELFQGLRGLEAGVP